MGELPTSLHELSPEWLTVALGDLLGGGTVSSVLVDDIGVGVGVFGTIGRLKLTYSDAGPLAPSTLIAKLPTDAEANRAVGVALGLYEREHHFYRTFADAPPFPMARCYLTLGDPGAGRWVLLLEDLGRLEAGDQLAGLGPGRATRMVETLAAFHAAWWESPDLEDMTWLPTQDHPMYLASVPPLVSAGMDALAGSDLHLPAGALELGRRVDAVFPEIIHRCAAGPRTMVIGDARLDNLFFLPGTDEPTVIDFQMALRCRGVYDLVWLLATSMDPAVQDAHADALLARYHRTLAEHGIRISEGDLRRAAAEHAAYLLSGPLSLMGTFDFSSLGNGRSAELTRRWVARGFNLALRYGAADVL